MANNMLHEYITKTKNIIFEHKYRVAKYMQYMINDLVIRMIKHDDSKFSAIELEAYSKALPGFKIHKHGTPEYDIIKQELGPALLHHYLHNKHHPEHFETGVNEMDLVDLIEMLCDWKSATENHPEHQTTMLESITVSCEKYKISPQLKQVLLNTAKNYNLL